MTFVLSRRSALVSGDHHLKQVSPINNIGGIPSMRRVGIRDELESPADVVRQSDWLGMLAVSPVGRCWIGDGDRGCWGRVLDFDFMEE
jgi:hypothetical protein